MSRTYDVAIAGLGAMGSAVAYHAARGGARVIGFDRFAPPHDRGSSHGLTRIIREAYFEDPRYVPLVQRAYALWRELERDAGVKLLTPTGGLMIGRPESVVVSGAVRSAKEHGLPYQLLDAATITSRFPPLAPAPDMVGVFEPNAGVLVPEACVAAHLKLAKRAGAELHLEEPVIAWHAEGPGVEVRTARRAYQARRLVLAVGAWTTGLAQDAMPPLTIERQTLFWFRPVPGATEWRGADVPIHIWEWERGKYFYGFPPADGTFKVAMHHGGEPGDPDKLRRNVSLEEIEEMRALLDRFMPGVGGKVASTAVCMYTNTPDEHFLIDRHPRHAQVMIVSACSGHGFKFSSAIGEAVAGAVMEGEVPEEMRLFGWRW